MKSCKSILLVTLTLILLPLGSRAELGPIIITPTRTAQTENTSSATVYVLSREEIEKSGASNTSELLRGMPGIQVDDLFGNGTEVVISVRGFSSTANANTLVLVNGRRLNHSDTRGPDLHHIFPKDIERIEVLVGSAGSLYGDQAVGGVINIITKGPVSNHQEIGVKLGSYNYRGVEFNSSKQLTDSLGYRLSAETFKADHYRDHNAEKNANVRAVLEYTKEKDSLFLELQRITDELELPGALLEDEFNDDPTQSHPSFANDFYNADTSVARVGYKRTFGAHAFSIDTTHRTTDADVLQSFRGFPSPSAGFNNRKSISLNPKLAGVMKVGINTDYVVGVDLENVDYDLFIPNAFGARTSSSEQESRGVFFQVNPNLTQKLQLTFGARHAQVENMMKDAFSFPAGIEVDDDLTVYELGLAYRVDNRTKLTFRYDENFRFAKVNELALAAPGVVLDTQTGESIEFGITLVRGINQFTASVYQLNLENEIEFDPILFLNTNLDKTQRNGFTLSLLSQINKMLSIKTELGYVDPKFRSGAFDGNDISGVASEIAKIRGDYQINDDLTSYLEVNYTGPKYAQGDNANEFDKLDSITVINAGVGYQLMAWKFHFRINNLADEKYADFITNFGAYQPSPDRNYWLTASYRFD